MCSWQGQQRGRAALLSKELIYSLAVSLSICTNCHLNVGLLMNSAAVEFKLSYTSDHLSSTSEDQQTQSSGPYLLKVTRLRTAVSSTKKLADGVALKMAMISRSLHTPKS